MTLRELAPKDSSHSSMSSGKLRGFPYRLFDFMHHDWFFYLGPLSEIENSTYPVVCHIKSVSHETHLQSNLGAVCVSHWFQSSVSSFLHLLPSLPKPFSSR